MSSVTLMSGSALSLEGKNLWIPKVLPVRDREILLSKTLPQIIVSVPFTVISAIVIIIGFALPIKYIPFVILTPVIANASFAFLGSVINVLFPKFDYVNEAQVIKQSLSSFLLLLAQSLISLGVIAIAVVFVIIKLSYLAHVIILSVSVMLCVLFAALLLGPLSKKYSKIEV
jgi:ABC-2 type transport system permease protein